MKAFLIFFSVSSALFSNCSSTCLRYQTSVVTSELFFDLSRNESHRTGYEFPFYFEEGSFAVVLAKKNRVLKGKYLWSHPVRTFNKCLPYDFSVPETFSFLASAAGSEEPLPEDQKFIPLPEAPPLKNPS